MAKTALYDGQGFQAFEEDGKIVLVIDPKAPTQRSKSGKSEVVASSRGNVRLQLDGTDFYLGLNFYKKA